MESIKQTASKVGEVAQDTLSTGAAVGGIALHAAEQRRHEMMRDWEKEHAVSEKNTPHGRKEAAKSALEHHYEAKEHALAAAHLEEDKGVRKMEETISSATGAVSGVVSAVKGKAQETVTAAANMSRLAAEAALEQKAAAQESYYKSRAVQESLTPHARKEAAKSALEAHIDRKEHAQEKARLEEELGVRERIEQAKATASTAADYARHGAARAGQVIIPYLQAAKESVTSAASAAAHLALEKKHEMQETWARKKAESEKVSAHERKEAAKQALEHHMKAQAHSSHTSSTLGDMIGWLWRFLIAILSSVATAAYHLPANVYHAIMAAASVASSTASAAAHATLETKEKVQERIAQNAAVSESVSPHERMERAKSALEHHEAALAHATAKEQRKKEAGLDYVEEKVSESFQSAKEHAGSVAANVTGTLRGTFQAVEQKTHELQESYYKGQAVSENRSPAERMEAAKKALGHHQAASKTS